MQSSGTTFSCLERRVLQDRSRHTYTSNVAYYRHHVVVLWDVNTTEQTSQRHALDDKRHISYDMHCSHEALKQTVPNLLLHALSFISSLPPLLLLRSLPALAKWQHVMDDVYAHPTHIYGLCSLISHFYKSNSIRVQPTLPQKMQKEMLWETPIGHGESSELPDLNGWLRLFQHSCWLGCIKLYCFRCSRFLLCVALPWFRKSSRFWCPW